jgi:site-specific DNA-cytosine methylase
MRVLIACEFSGIVRDAFIARGHDAISVDLLPSESDAGPHVQMDVLEFIDKMPGAFDLMVAHPPCTHLAVSGARHFWRKQQEQEDALEFVRALLHAPIPRIALENPVSIISSRLRPADSVCHPWQFGHPEMKTTCFWLKNLPPLKPTKIVWDEMQTLSKAEKNRVLWMGRDHWMDRSRTFQGFADAMADQWGKEHPIQMTLDGAA